MSRERRKEQLYNGVLGPGRDFSVIRSARKACSQLLLGPARFVNHDCNPNCEFYRLGHSNMIFKCLRDIGLNEEITTFYGENYFEASNSECMCLTCEERGHGIFVAFTQAGKEDPPAETHDRTSDESISDQKSKRRVSLRKGRSPPPPPQPAPKTTLTIKRKGKEERKTFNHTITLREDDGDVFPHPGPKFTCVTCGEPSWAFAEWWTPDECRRCEHHFRIFKADWPGRSPTEGEWSDKARASRLRRQLMAGEDVEHKRSGRSLDEFVSSTGTTPEVGSPVSLEPLEGPGRNDVLLGRTKRRKSQTPVTEATWRKKKRVSAETETSAGNNSGVGSLAHRVVASRRNAGNSVRDESDADSDLTSVSANDVDEALLAVRVSDRGSPSSLSSSTSESRSCGPKSLGKQARTETLAMFWGASESEKRARRPRYNGLESLSGTVQRPDGSRHRRTASDMSFGSHSKRSRLSPTVHADGDDQQRFSSASIGVGPSTSQSPPGHPFPLPDKGLSRTISESHVLNRLDAHSQAMGPDGLATRGPERTSDKNLARAWGADIQESGRGSRRRGSARNVGTPAALSSPKRSRHDEISSGSRGGSATPLPGRRADPDRMEIETPRPSSAITTPKATPAEEKPASPAMHSSALPSEIIDAKTSPMRLEPSSVDEPKVVPSTMPSAPPSLKSGSNSPDSASMSVASTAPNALPTPPMQAKSVAGLERSTSPSLQPLSGTESGVGRTTSPLAGPPPTTFATRPGIVPGQPIRRNLRWGKGKMSSSRPLGPGLGSPLAGPAALGSRGQTPVRPPEMPDGAASQQHSGGSLPSPPSTREQILERPTLSTSSSLNLINGEPEPVPVEPIIQATSAAPTYPVSNGTHTAYRGGSLHDRKDIKLDHDTLHVRGTNGGGAAAAAPHSGVNGAGPKVKAEHVPNGDEASYP